MGEGMTDTTTTSALRIDVNDPDVREIGAFLHHALEPISHNCTRGCRLASDALAACMVSRLMELGWKKPTTDPEVALPRADRNLQT